MDLGYTAIYSIILMGILTSSSPVLAQNCTTMDCYVQLGKAPSSLLAFRKCVNNGYLPVRISNKETSDLLAETHSKFWVPILSHDPGYYSYVNGRTYHKFIGEAPPPSQRQCAYIHSEKLTESVNPFLEYCYKRYNALCKYNNCFDDRQNCYFFTNKMQTWFESRNECLSQSADLADVVMANRVPSFQGQSWIGLRHQIWRYADLEEETTYTNWAPNRPENVDNKCVVVLGNGKWVDVPCEGEEYNVLCYTEEPQSDTNTTALIAGVTVAAIVLLVIIILLIYFLWNRNLCCTGPCSCSCSCLPLHCCDKKKQTNTDKPKTNATKSDNKSKRQSVRDFVSSIKVPNFQKPLFKSRSKNNEENSNSTDNQMHGYHSQTSEQESQSATPFRKAPPPPIKKKTKPLPPVPGKRRALGAEGKLTRPFSGLKESIKKHLSRSQGESSQNVPRNRSDEPQAGRQARTSDNDQYEPMQFDSGSEPKFLDNRQVIPVSEMTVKRQKNLTPTTPGGSSNKLPPPPARKAPDLNDVIRKNLPPLPPPKHKVDNPRNSRC